MSDEYLWDRTGAEDAEVQELERLLARYAQGAGAGAGRPAAALSSPRPAGTWATVLATAAVALLAIGVAWMGTTLPGPAAVDVGWRLAAVDGTPLVASRPVGADQLVRRGAWIETDTHSTARLDVGDAGRLLIAPNSRLRITRAAPGDHRLQMEHGTVDALIWAPPGQVVLSTPGATAVDLGCAYTLSVDADGHGTLVVTSGWVGLIHEGHEAFIPADASVAVYGDDGPGTPTAGSASPALVDAVRAFDRARSDADSLAALDVVLRTAEADDTLTLWHLLDRVSSSHRGRVHDALASRLDTPPGVTREGVAEGNRDMIDAWWSALGHGDVDWWRLWRRDWQPHDGASR